MYNNTSNIIICDHPLIKHKLSVIRDQETGTSEFRTIMQELAMLIGYEAMRDLPLNDVEIRTPAEIAKCPFLSGRKPVFVPIMRAGLGMYEGIIKLIPNAKVGHIGVSRDKKTFEASEYICKMPSSLSERKIYVMDPMLATGGSAIAAIDSIKKHGGIDITFLCVVAAPIGLEALHTAHPDIKIVVGNLDREINERAYVCPGFGNAGDRYFGTVSLK